jgi:hypothetical protein
LRNWIQSHSTSTNNSNNNAKTKAKANQNKKNKPPANNIFLKLNQAAAAQKTNSILMRDNPSPVHLFKKLSLQHEQKDSNANLLEGPKTLLDHLMAFCEGLTGIRVKKSAIRTAVSSVIN